MKQLKAHFNYGRRLRFEERSDQSKDYHAKDIVAFTEIMKKKFGVDVYMIYGTLLAAVRDGDFIPEDKDIDVAYVSKYSDYDDIVKEMVEIYQFFYDNNLLRDFGGSSKYPRYCGHAHLFYPERRTELDVWTSWIDKNGKFNFWFIGKELDKSILYPLTTKKLRGQDVQVPNKNRVLLRYIYSHAWKIPIANAKGKMYTDVRMPALCEMCKNPVKGVIE